MTTDHWVYDESRGYIFDGDALPIAYDVVHRHGPTLAAAGRMAAMLRAVMPPRMAAHAEGLSRYHDARVSCRCPECREYRAILAEIDRRTRP